MTQPSPADTQRLLLEAREFRQKARFEDALARYDQLLAHQPDFFEALYNRGILLWEMKRDEDALASLEKAIAIRPGYAATWNNRGNVLRNLGRHEEALASFDQALSLKPDFPGAHYNRANVLLLNLKRAEDALAAYDRALALNPGFAEAWNNRGNALCSLGRLTQSLASYDRALAIRPDFIDAMNCRGQVLFESNRIEEGIASFMRAAALIPGQNPLADPPHKLRHDREQQDYLAGIRGRYSAPAGARVAGSAVAPSNGAAAEQWRTKKPQIAVVDNLLTPAALEGLRRFCLEPPMWRRSYDNGYLGAFPEQGFACPLLGQVAEELRGAYPAIFRAHPLLYMWGFKYDSQLTGIAIHADESAVNVNFWLTPDDANLDPQSGGLVIWDVAAPLNWDFPKFNADSTAIRDFLAKAGAKSVTVPYRANRAVIFDSDLFHETDQIRFREGYLNRRINVTMLYGRRERDHL
ncbi:MAG TPA: tetratricopeptide repeat protein [Rhizomicrobium sp.]|nr:tetratricopeptide repeat protein [Rhizomicrobium sp.]